MITHTELLSKLVSFPTVTGQFDEIVSCLKWISDLIMHETGIKGSWHIFSKHRSLAFRAADMPLLSLIGHIDVVPGISRQFRLKKAGNKLIGRGVLDMKGPIVSMIASFCVLALQGVAVELILTSDEEIGGHNGILSLVNKGIIHPQTAIIPDGLNGFNSIIKQKGPAHIFIKAKGIACHASRPWKGVNASSHIIKTVEEIQRTFNFATRDAVWLPTATLTTLSSDSAINQVPENATACIDLRITEKEVGWLGVIKKIAQKHHCSIEKIHGDGTVFTQNEDALKQSLWDDSVKSVTGMEVNKISSCGASDARHLPKDCFTIITSLPGEGAHGRMEWIVAGAMEDLSKIINNFATNLVANT